MNNKASQELLVYFNEVFRWRRYGGWECNFPESSSLKCPLWTVIPFYGGWTIQMESEESLDFRGTRSCFWKAVTCTLLRIRVTPVLRTCLSGPQVTNRLHACQRVCHTSRSFFSMVYRRVCPDHTVLAHDLGAHSGLLHSTRVNEDKCVLRWVEALKGINSHWSMC